MTTKIEKALNSGKIKGAKALLSNYYLAEDESKWLNDKQSEYELIYPPYRDMTNEEKLANDTVEDEVIVREEDYVYPQIAIDYSEDESYVTFNEWINETIITQEYVEATYDEEGMVITAEVPEITELVRPYTPVSVTDRVDGYLAPYNLQIAKDAKQVELDTLIVEANTVPFDGNIQSIGYMSSVLALANFKMIQAVSAGVSMADAYDGIYKTIVQWKNANDSISDVQLETVAEALEKAMMAIATIKTT